MQEEIRKILAQYAEEQYKEFSAGLIPGAKPLMGVRLPKIRQIAKSIVADKNNKSRWRDETATFDGVYEDLFFEESQTDLAWFKKSCSLSHQFLNLKEHFILQVRPSVDSKIAA